MQAIAGEAGMLQLTGSFWRLRLSTAPGDEMIMRQIFCLVLLMTGLAGLGCTRQATPADAAAPATRNATNDAASDGRGANGQATADRPIKDGNEAASRVVKLKGDVDETPDAAFADRVRVDFVGCRDLGGQDPCRLAHFRFEYAWESARQLERRLRQPEPATGANSGTSTDDAPDPILWVPFETDSQGRAGLPLAPDLTGNNLLHIRLKEPGWDWFTFPAGRHPGTLAGAHAFELQPHQRNLRAVLVGGG